MLPHRYFVPTFGNNQSTSTVVISTDQLHQDPLNNNTAYKVRSSVRYYPEPPELQIQNPIQEQIYNSPSKKQNTITIAAAALENITSPTSPSNEKNNNNNNDDLRQDETDVIPSILKSTADIRKSVRYYPEPLELQPVPASLILHAQIEHQHEIAVHLSAQREEQTHYGHQLGENTTRTGTVTGYGVAETPIPHSQNQVSSPYSYERQFQRATTTSCNENNNLTFFSPNPPLRVPFTSPDNNNNNNYIEETNNANSRFVRTGDEIPSHLMISSPEAIRYHQQNAVSNNSSIRASSAATTSVPPQWAIPAGSQRSTLNEIMSRRSTERTSSQQGSNNKNVSLSNKLPYPTPSINPNSARNYYRGENSSEVGSNDTQRPSSPQTQEAQQQRQQTATEIEEQISSSNNNNNEISHGITPTTAIEPSSLISMQNNNNNNMNQLTSSQQSQDQTQSYSSSSVATPTSPLRQQFSDQNNQNNNNNNNATKSVGNVNERGQPGKHYYSQFPPYVSAFRRELDELRTDITSIRTVVHGMDKKIERVTGDAFGRLEGKLEGIQQSMLFEVRKMLTKTTTVVENHQNNTEQKQQRQDDAVPSSSLRLTPIKNVHIPLLQTTSENTMQSNHHNQNETHSPGRPLALLQSPLPKRILEQQQQAQISLRSSSTPIVPLSGSLRQNEASTPKNNTGGMFLEQLQQDDNKNQKQQQPTSVDLDKLVLAVQKLSERVDVIAASTSSAISSLAAALSGFSANQSKHVAVEAEKTATRSHHEENHTNVNGDDKSHGASSLL